MRVTRIVDGTIVLNLIVILLGATVRATGSGAGCGRSWPTCQGELLPALEGATAIEFTHRAVSGLALLAVAWMVFAVFKASTSGALVRRAAVAVAISIVVEALIGMVIVLAEWVADDASVARAVSVPIHLVSTFVLLAGLVMTRFWLRHDVSGHRRLRDHPGLIVLGVGMLLVAATGAVTALADTLFPKAFDLTSMVTPEEHFLTRLRVVHPIVAVVVGGAAGWFAARHMDGRAARPAGVVIGSVIVQVALGVLAVALLTPLAISLLHLLVADVLWMAWIWLGLELTAERSGNASPALDVSTHR
ncbi:MAG TPA: COX15/CtaA family protein [Acidimicrobiia bacterium]|nr:COX15/CtaA family protein [Acidimicrobiia bacterium]